MIYLSIAGKKLLSWFNRYRITPGAYNYGLNYYGYRHTHRRGAFTATMAELIRYGY